MSDKTKKERLIDILQQVLSTVHTSKVNDFECIIDYGTQEKFTSYASRDIEYNGKRHISIKIHLQDQKEK